MNSYRLLRSNKESGPYSAEEMISLGFKAYDLIWVDGKSAGWRYPSELPEFKAFAPITEEQPFDRFFKKTDDKKTAAQEAIAVEELQAVAAAAPAPVMPAASPERFAPEPARVPAYTVVPSPVGKHIYVTMPAGSAKVAAEMPVKKEAPAATGVKDAGETIAAPAGRQETAPPPAATPSPFKEDRKERMEEIAAKPSVTGRSRFSNSFDSAEQQDDTLAFIPRKKFRAEHLPWRLIAALFAGVAILVGLGIFIGLSMTGPKKEIAGEKPAVQQPVQQPVAQQEPALPKEGHVSPVVVSPSPDTVSNTQPPARVKEQAAPAGAAAVVSGPSRTHPEAFRKSAAHKRYGEKPAGITAPVAAAKQAEAPPVASGRAIPENIATPAQKNAATNVAAGLKEVGFKINGYKVGAFGGVSDIQCTLINDSRSPLQQVEVEVDYILANNKVFKTETLSFTDIAAGTHVMLTAPRSARGIKVVSRIKKVTVRENNFTNITVKS